MDALGGYYVDLHGTICCQLIFCLCDAVRLSFNLGPVRSRNHFLAFSSRKTIFRCLVLFSSSAPGYTAWLE